MTTTPDRLTAEREQEIRMLDLLELMDDRSAPVISGHLAVLLAEIDRLRAQRQFLLGQLAKKDAESGAGDKALREFLAGEEA